MLPRLLRPRRIFACAATAFLAASPTFAASITTSDLKDNAAREENAGNWNEALRLYTQLAREDQGDPQTITKVQDCLRRVLQSKRQREAGERDSFLGISFAQALKTYGEALDKIQTHYVEKEKGKVARLFAQGVQELEASLGDAAFQKRYLSEMAPEQVKAFRAYLDQSRRTIRPATAADALKAVEEIANRARREWSFRASNAVVLEFLCGACHSLDAYSSYVPGNGEEAKSPPITVISQMPRLGVGYLKINEFTSATPRQVEDALDEMRMQQNLKSLVIDLRGNTGGLLEGAVDVARKFLPAGVIVSLNGQLPEANKTFQATGGMGVIDVPIVLLVDQGTASAAEVLAAALGQNRRATVIGVPTYGKGSLQSLLQFNTGSSVDESGKKKPASTGGVRITLAKIQGPNGAALNGVTPHVLERDPARQLDAALDLAGRSERGMP